MLEIPIWAGWLIIFGFVGWSALSAIFYQFIWWDLLQRYEPISAQLGRICAKRPWLWYSINIIILGGVIVAAILAPWWIRVICVLITGFFGWFLPHIVTYAEDPNNPPHVVKAFRWVERK